MVKVPPVDTASAAMSEVSGEGSVAPVEPALSVPEGPACSDACATQANAEGAVVPPKDDETELASALWSKLTSDARPISHDIEASAMGLQEVLQKVIGGMAASTNDNDLMDDGVFSDKEKMQIKLYRVIASEALDMKSAEGQKFYYELRKNSEELANYKACKSKEDMSAFRKAFCEKKLSIIREKKIKTDSVFDLSKVDAEYCAFPRVVQREGGDVLAFATAKEWIASAIEKFGAGKTFHGHPWVKTDPMRKTTVVLHYRETLAVGQEKRWSLETVATNDVGRTDVPAAEAAAAGNAGSDKPIKQEAGATPTVETAPAAPKGAGAKGAKRGAGAIDATNKKGTGKGNKQPKVAPQAPDAKKGGEGDDTPDDMKKRVGIEATKFASLKTDYNSAAQAASDLLSTISNNDEWLWLRDNKLLLKPLRSALNDAESRKNQSDVWKAWTLQKDFVKYCKTQLDPEVVLAEALQIDSFKKIIDKINTQTQKLHSMHGVLCKGED